MKLYSATGIIRRVNTDLGGADGFVEVTNIECYAIPSLNNGLVMSSASGGDFGIVVCEMNGIYVIDSLRLCLGKRPEFKRLLYV